MRNNILILLFFTMGCSTVERYIASEKKLVGNEFIVANLFWDPEHNFVINETKEYYHYTYQQSPFQLGETFGQIWKVKTDKLESIYKLPRLDLFGTFNAYYKNKFLYMVRTNQYYLGHRDNKPQLGLRFLPYDEKQGVYTDLDEYIRARYDLEAEDVFVAPTYYFHQEYYRGDITQLEKNSRFDDGFTHMGAYIGNGQTRNAPYDYYEDMKLKNRGYPTNLVKVVYKGAKEQKEFQKNFYTSLRLLNELNGGVKFSRLSYQQDYYEANNLKSIFDFYRAWLDPKWIRKKEDGKPFYEIILEDVKYDVYCSEHITMVLNLALNLVQTEAGYIRVFGKDIEQASRGEAEQENGILKGGEYFWKLANQRWAKEIKGKTFPMVDDDDLQELWRLYNKKDPSIIVTHITEVGKYLAWPPQTLTDLIANVMDLYARFDVVGKDVSIQILKGMKDMILQRVTFLDKSKQFIKNSIVDFPVDKLDRLIKPFEQLIEKYCKDTDCIGLVKNYKKFQMDAAKLVFLYRDPKYLRLKEDSFFYYATPHVIHRIIQGLHPYSKYLEFEIIGTALPSNDLELDNN